MEKILNYTPSGVCSRGIEVAVEDGIVRRVTITGGCHGNAQGIAALVVGMPVTAVIARLRGIDCKGKGTSCPDQLAQCLGQLLESR